MSNDLEFKLKTLGKVLEFLPGHIYWKDKHGKYPPMSAPDADLRQSQEKPPLLVGGLFALRVHPAYSTHQIIRHGELVDQRFEPVVAKDSESKGVSSAPSSNTCSR